MILDLALPFFPPSCPTSLFLFLLFAYVIFVGFPNVPRSVAVEVSRCEYWSDPLPPLRLLLLPVPLMLSYVFPSRLSALLTFILSYPLGFHSCYSYINLL